MQRPPLAPRELARWPRWAAIAIAAAVPAAIDTGHDLARGERITASCAGFAFAGVLLALVALTATFDLCQRRRLGWSSCFALVAGVAIVAALAERLAGGAIQRATGIALVGDLREHAGGARAIGAAVFDGLLALGLWAVAIVFPFAVRDANARALEADRLRTAAELARLRAHLQPHFLLNTLNTVSGLIGGAPDEARRLVGALGDLLRDSLEDSDEMQTLEAEMGWLRRYAEILETRHRGVLEFHWEIADDTRHVKVPRLLLQPLVENAVTHGALRRRDGGQVTVTTTLDAERRVRCVVEDNGPGPSSQGPRPGALGIQLVTRRLAIRYAGAASFRLESSGGRTRCIVELPAEAPR